jgi:hypothetical protein
MATKPQRKGYNVWFMGSPFRRDEQRQRHVNLTRLARSLNERCQVTKKLTQHVIVQLSLQTRNNGLRFCRCLRQQVCELRTLERVQFGMAFESHPHNFRNLCRPELVKTLDIGFRLDEDGT